jgi:hypothetical protein
MEVLLVCLLACCLYCVYKHLEALVPGRVRGRVNTINSFFSQQSHLHRYRLIRMQPKRQPQSYLGSYSGSLRLAAPKPLKEKVPREPYLVSLRNSPRCVRNLGDCYLCSYTQKILAFCLGKRYERSKERIRTTTSALGVTKTSV